MALRDGAAAISPAFLAAEAVPLSSLFSLDGSIPQQPLELGSVSSFLHHSMATSATKVGGDDSWSMRVAASSGNLHSTETYLFLPAALTDEDAAGTTLHHYGAESHSLAARATYPAAAATDALAAEGCFLVALSSVWWRQAWKYGDRGWRYSELDCGHAIGALRLAAAMHGWLATLVPGLPDAAIAAALGLDRYEDFVELEEEVPVVVLAVGPSPAGLRAASAALRSMAEAAADAEWEGEAAALHGEDEHHDFDSSPVIASVIAATALSADAAASRYDTSHRQRPSISSLV